MNVYSNFSIYLINYTTWWRHQMETFPRHWPFLRGMHQWPVNSPHKGQWRGALMFSLIWAWIKGSVNNLEAGDLRRHRAHPFTLMYLLIHALISHDDVIKWKHFPRNWPIVRGIHRSRWIPQVNSPHKGQWRGALMFSLICVWINGWVNNREAGNLRRHRDHYDVNVMIMF